MLVIEINSDDQSPLTLTELNKYDITRPPNGFDLEENNAIVMKFADEQEAINYSYELDNYANSIDNSSMEYRIVTAIIKSISNDGFVQSYIQD